MLTLQPAPTESEPRRCTWGVIHTGYIDANSMFMPRVKRKICYWQLTCLGLFGPSDLDVNRVLNAYLHRQDRGPISPQFCVVIFYASADYLSNLVYHTVMPGESTGKTPTDAIEDIKRKIRYTCQNFPGSPPKIWAGVGFVGSNVTLRHGIKSNKVITGASWDDAAGSPDALAHRYFDQVLARVHWDLCSTRCVSGIFNCVANTETSEDQLLPVFNPGSLALRAETTGRAYPVAGDLANATRVMVGTISGVLKKLNVGNRDGICFVHYDQNPDRWGYPPMWGPNVGLLAAKPVVLAELPVCQDMPYHLYSVPGAIVVRHVLCLFI